MIRTTLLLVLSLTIVSCGWNYSCIRTSSCNPGEEKVAAVGTSMVQTGCFAGRYEPTGLNKSLWNKTAYNDDGFEPLIDKELLYAGRAGDILHITYREYSTQVTAEGRLGNYARTPFFQQVYYDLNKSDKIVFQNWVLKVLEASNEQIRFKVIE